jgi:hypothetical protein
MTEPTYSRLEDDPAAPTYSLDHLTDDQVDALLGQLDVLEQIRAERDAGRSAGGLA